MRNQATFLLRQCVGVSATDVRGDQGTTPAATSAPTSAAAEPAPGEPTEPTEPTEPAEAPAKAPTRTTERAGESARATPATPARSAATPPTPAAPRPAASTAKPTSAEPATPAPAARPSRPGFAVQVAAFSDVAQARALVATLREQGVDARVDRDGSWHKVRAGHFASRAEASAHAKRLEAKGVKGFVTGVAGR